MISTLERSNDRKVANAVKVSSKGLASPRVKNAFGLLAGPQGSCPDATAFCVAHCYAGAESNGSEKIFPSVKALVTRNYEALSSASRDEMISMLDTMISEFSAECEKHAASKLFRIHWDGDFFSGIYAAAWSHVIKAHADVSFWAYTRVGSAASYLQAQKHENLSLYFSADPDNAHVVPEMQRKGIRIAYVARSFAEAKEALPRGVRCPENNRAIPLISDKGSACRRCGLCIHGRGDVLFSTTKK